MLKHIIHSPSDSIKFTSYSDADEVVDELFLSHLIQDFKNI